MVSTETRHEGIDMDWPNTLIPTRRTDEFDEKTLPKGLLKDHATKAGVWAMIRVVEGTLIFRQGDEEYELHPKKPGFVEPEVPHSIEPKGAVRFYIEFYRNASAG